MKLWYFPTGGPSAGGASDGSAPAGLTIDSLTLHEAEVTRPGRGQVLVRMHAASLNYRDLMIATGRSARGALLPDLVSAVASLASLAPLDGDGLDWFAGMGELNADDTRLFLRDREAARAKLEADREEVLEASPADLAGRLRTLLSPTDEGLAPSVEGWWDDGVVHCTPWGFELSAISVPVLLMHGRQDQFVPFGHGQWLAAHIPGVEARLFDHDGHLTLLTNRVPEVHAWLKDRL